MFSRNLGGVLMLSMLCFLSGATAQDMVFDWVKTYEESGGESEIYNQFFQADSANLYISGIVLSANNDFDPGPGTYNLSAPYNRSFHVSKYDLDGNHIRSGVFGSTQFSNGGIYTRLLDMKLNSSGNLYLCGTFLDTLYYETASGIQYEVSSGYTDIFFGKMDTSGNWLWMKTYGGIYDEVSAALSITDDDEVYLSGSYSDSVAFMPGEPPLFTPAYALFMLKFNASDQEQWVYSTDNQTTLPVFEVNSMCVDYQDGIFIGGDYFDYSGDSVNFQSSGNTFLLENANDYDGFLLKLDTAGVFQWVKSYRTTASDHVDRLVFNSTSNDILVSGRSGYDTLDFDPSTLADSMSFPSNQYGNYLLSLTPDGQYKWLNQLFYSYGVGVDFIMYLTTDSKGNIHGVSTFDNEIDAHPGVNDTILYGTTPGGVNNSSYSIKMDSLGNYIWSYHYKTASNGDYAYGIGKDPYDNVYVGLFNGVTSSDTLVLGNISEINTQFSRHFIKLISCGSQFVYQLNDSTAKADAVNATYQWLNCDNGYAPVTDATDRSFLPDSPGNYALQSTSYTCTDTSDCVYLERHEPSTALGLEYPEVPSVVNDNFFTIYPNPTRGTISINLLDTSVSSVVIRNIMGDQVFSIRVYSGDKIDIPGAPGIYTIEALTHHKKIIKRIVKTD